MARRLALPAVIPASGTTTATITIPEGKRVVGLIMPSTFTGTTLTFKAGYSTSATPQPVYNEGSAYSVACATDRFIAVNPNVFLGAFTLQIISGSTEGSERTIQVITAD